MNIAIVGATGNVGRKILEVLEKKELFIENLYLVASLKSVGSKIKFNGKEHEVLDLENFDFSKAKITFCPTLLGEATKYNSLKGRFFRSKISSVFLPTFPVAPTIAIFMIFLNFYTR